MITLLSEKQCDKIVEREASKASKQKLSDHDPDFGLEFHLEFEKSLKRSIDSGKSKKTKSLDEVPSHLK
ncbi:MAG: hypothetical protein Q8L47_00185 [bacterium]|nr:hypothetical protein [bacterium]